MENLDQSFVRIVKTYFKSLMVVLALVLRVDPATAGSVSLTWDPSPDTNVIGYKIYYGTASQVYTTNLVVGNVTNTTINGLAAGANFYFAATGYDAAGDESAFSNEAFYHVTNSAPTLDPIAALSISENAGGQSFNLTGITSGDANEGETLTVTAVSSNPTLLSTLGINYASPNNAGTLSFVPVANTSGVATITVTVSNSVTSSVVTQSFAVTVLAPAEGATTLPVPSIAPQNTPARLTPQPSGIAGQFSFLVSGHSGSQYIVQATTDMVNWIPVQTNFPPFTVVDTKAGACAQRFYRAVLVQ